MIDLQPAPVPDLSDEWIASHQMALVAVLSQRRRRSLRWVALAGATGAAAAVSSLVLVGGGEQSAFAGWSSSPTPPTSGQVTSAAAECQADLAQLPPSSNKGTEAAPLVPKLSDVRGPYTVTVLGNRTGSGVLCITTPDGNSALRWLMQSGEPVSTGAIAVDQDSVSARESQAYTLVEGRAGDGVTGVTLVLGNGRTVTATSGNGVFVAWWPGSESITSAIVSTATGVTTQTLNLPGAAIPSSPKSATAVSSRDPLVLHSECGSRLFGRDSGAFLKVTVRATTATSPAVTSTPPPSARDHRPAREAGPAPRGGAPR